MDRKPLSGWTIQGQDGLLEAKVSDKGALYLPTLSPSVYVLSLNGLSSATPRSGHEITGLSFIPHTKC